MLYDLPLICIVFRFIVAIAIFFNTKNRFFQKFFPLIFVLGFLLDFFDGYFARKIGIFPRIIGYLDGYADVSLYLATLYFLLKNYPDQIRRYRYAIIGLIGLMFISWLYSYLKFGKLTSYHGYTAKWWGISIFFAVMQISIFRKSSLFIFMIVFGIINIADEIGITYVMPYWKTGISSIKQAVLLADQYKELNR